MFQITQQQKRTLLKTPRKANIFKKCFIDDNQDNQKLKYGEIIKNLKLGWTSEISFLLSREHFHGNKFWQIISAKRERNVRILVEF